MGLGMYGRMCVVNGIVNDFDGWEPALFEFLKKLSDLGCKPSTGGNLNTSRIKRDAVTSVGKFLQLGHALRIDETGSRDSQKRARVETVADRCHAFSVEIAIPSYIYA